MGAITLDTSRWPIALFTFDGEQVDEDVDFFIQSVEKIHADGKDYASIGYMKHLKPNAGHVRRVGKAMLKSWPDAKKYCRGSAIVVSNPTFRFMLSSFFLITPIPYPYIVTDSLEEAIQWTTEQFTKSGEEANAASA